MTDAEERDPESVGRLLTGPKRGILLRPTCPDTLAFICESAGFATAEIRRLSPVPEADPLPASAPDGGPLADHLDRVVARLDALLYGFQDYVVVARR